MAVPQYAGWNSGASGELVRFCNFAGSCPVRIVSLRNGHNRSLQGYLQLLPSWKKATALAAATFSESTPWVMGILTV